MGLCLLGAAGAASSPLAGQDITFEGATSAETTGTSLVISKPAGTTVDAVMIASIGVRPETTGITPPTGWVLVRRLDNSSATANSLAVYRKVAIAGEPASYTWTLSGQTAASGGIQTFAGVDGANPIDVENGQTTPSSVTHSTPSVNTSVDDTMLVTSHTFSSSEDWTPPSGMTEAFDVGTNGQSTEGSYVLQASAGATGAKTATAAGDADVGNAHILALRPAAREFVVGSFTKSTAGAPVAQVVPHGLDGAPKALLLWTAGRTDEAFGGTIAFRAAASATALTGDLTIAKPSGTVEDDVMVASIGLRPDTSGITPPTGWTLVRRIDNAVDNANSLAVYRKTAGASEPANYTWTLTGQTHSAGGIQSFSGVDTANPIDVENGQTTASGLTHATPSITTTVSNTMLVASHTMSSGATWTPPSGMTEGFDTSVGTETGQATEGSYALQATPGASGAKTATASQNADVGNTHLLALKPEPVEAYFGLGMTDGTTDKAVAAASQDDVGTTNASRRVANKALTIVQGGEVVLAEADLQSWDATNFTLNWTTNDANPYVVHFVAIGGGFVSAKVLDWAMATSTGNLAVTGVGFRPNVVIHAHAGAEVTASPPVSQADAAIGLGVMDANGDEWSLTHFADDNVTTSDTQRAQQTDATLLAIDASATVTKEASWVSMDSDGFTVNFSTANASAGRVVSLALRGVNVKGGAFAKSTGAAPASQSVTGVEFRPKVVLLTSFQDVTRASPVSHARFGIGAADGSVEGSSAIGDEDGATTANLDGIDKTSKVFVKVDNATPSIDAEADLTSLDSDGFTLEWTTNDAVATEILYFALAPLDHTDVGLMALEATRYADDVLVAWRTGYEVDNLGFHVHRAHGGARTRVTPSLVAGSGLQLAAGTRLSGERAYAWWDLGAPVEAADLVYWLEDVDLRGTSRWHGPVRPVEGPGAAVTEGAVGPDEGPAPPASGLLAGLGGSHRGRQRFFAMAANAGPGRAPRRTAEATQWSVAGGAAVKIGVRRAGWQRVDTATLLAAGLDAEVDPATLALYADGVAQAFEVVGGGDGRLDPGDAVEFYGEGVDTPATDTRVYWLTATGGAGSGAISPTPRARRVEEPIAPPSVAPAAGSPVAAGGSATRGRGTLEPPPATDAPRAVAAEPAATPEGGLGASRDFHHGLLAPAPAAVEASTTAAPIPTASALDSTEPSPPDVKVVSRANGPVAPAPDRWPVVWVGPSSREVDERATREAERDPDLAARWDESTDEAGDSDSEALVDAHAHRRASEALEALGYDASMSAAEYGRLQDLSARVTAGSPLAAADLVWLDARLAADPQYFARLPRRGRVSLERADGAAGDSAPIRARFLPGLDATSALLLSGAYERATREAEP